MPAPFVADVLGVRQDTLAPNTSDRHDSQSVVLGRALIEQVGLPVTRQGPPNPGDVMVRLTIEHLRSLRQDLVVSEGPASAFAQYEHLKAHPEFERRWRGLSGPLDALDRSVEALVDVPSRRAMTVAAARLRLRVEEQEAAVERLREQVPTESLLDLDLTVAEPNIEGRAHFLHIGISAKWSLRTDRAQDCVSQGNKLVALRRGRMPHFAVLTAEPRPAMLKILADGSGSVDCVYHLDLAALERTVRSVADLQKNPDTWSPRRTLERVLRQGRLRDYDDLVSEFLRLPLPNLSPPPPGPRGS